MADGLWVCSSLDRDRLVNDGADANASMLFRTAYRTQTASKIGRQATITGWRPTLLFIGHLYYPPNIEAALLLVKLMPALWDRIAGARLILAGRNPHPVISRRSQPGKIDVIANPSSTSPLLSNAHLAVMPLQRGGGTRIKALEAIAWGLPVVATARAVEGLQLENGFTSALPKPPGHSSRLSAISARIRAIRIPTHCGSTPCYGKFWPGGDPARGAWRAAACVASIQGSVTAYYRDCARGFDNFQIICIDRARSA